MTTHRASLPTFERLVNQRNHEQAFLTAIDMLEAIDAMYGRLDSAALGENAAGDTDEERAMVFCTRFAAAFGRLLTDPEFKLLGSVYEHLLMQHRWVDLIFAVSGFRTSDHLVPMLAGQEGDKTWTFGGTNALRLLAFFSTNSRFGLDFEQVWQANRGAAAVAFLHYIGSRYLFSPTGFEFRERLLEWIPDRLDEVKLGKPSLAKIAEIYMHCSYAFTPRKHAIKASIMRQMRRACLESGCVEARPVSHARLRQRPTVVVVAEQFSFGHAVYRTHSQAVRSLRERFHVVGVIYQNQISPPIEELFDQVVPMTQGEVFTGVRSLAADIVGREPALILYLGVGMAPHVIALASLRLAPIQCASFGHTATTMSPEIDYMILPEDFVGSLDCFSEKVLTVPREAMPFTPRSTSSSVSVKASNTAMDGPVRVGVPASTMKLNPRLFGTLKRISKTTKTPAEFQLLPLAAVGLAYIELARIIRQYIPTAIVHPETPYEAYVQRLANCDLFLCPFPYGNMNSIIDAISVGLPGVCLDGAEAHAHADAAIFARIGFPTALVAKTEDEYIAAAARLIDDTEWRIRCRQIAINCDLAAVFFRGNPSLFCKAIADLIWPPQK